MFRSNIQKYLSLIIIIISSLSISNKAFGQVYAWKLLRYEAFFGMGATNFMGDVGTPKNEGLKGFVWVNPQSIRPVGQIGLRMGVSPRTKLKGNLAIGMLMNDDKYGYYQRRFLQFRTLLVELSAQYEIYLVPEDRDDNNRYSNWLNLPTKLRNYLQPMYVFLGIGGIYTNPKGYTKGSWYSLHKFQTEGKDYSRLSMTFPVGIGFKFKIARYHAIYLEAGWRFAATDYIDDVSDGIILSTEEMLEKYGETAATLFYRGHGNMHSYMDNEGNYSTQGGISRGGGAWIDQYQFITISYSVVLKTNSKNRPTTEYYKFNEI